MQAVEMQVLQPKRIYSIQDSIPSPALTDKDHEVGEGKPAVLFQPSFISEYYQGILVELFS